MSKTFIPYTLHPHNASRATVSISQRCVSPMHCRRSCVEDRCAHTPALAPQSQQLT
ncbi:hypothetical protein LC593_31995 [Nostoc sp. CHAB 5844]|nr:hypothetical protein [Nostoc sp. CHAB 5844]